MVLEQLELLVALDVLLPECLVLLLQLPQLVGDPLLDASRLRLYLPGVLQPQLPLLLDLALQPRYLRTVRVTLLRPCQLLFHYSHLEEGTADEVITATWAGHGFGNTNSNHAIYGREYRARRALWKRVALRVGYLHI